MTHKDIYTKFMIEYDKANVTSSYPSLTEYEIATVLDKAYNALIAQKVTGNNVRRAGFETDLKSVTDIEPLVMEVAMTLEQYVDHLNVSFCHLPEDCMYYINAYLKHEATDSKGEPINSILGSNKSEVPVKLVSHDMASKFIVSAYNIPWVKIPVAYIHEDKLYIVYDPVNKPNISEEDSCLITYIKLPNKFVKDNLPTGGYTFFSWPKGISTPSQYEFECNDTVAEELVSLAIAFALENVESPRLNTKLNMRGLEA